MPPVCPPPVAEPWQTIRPQRSLLVVVHNVTAATRLLDLLPVIDGDVRLRIVFTCPGSSAFTAGTAELLAELNVTVLPWTQAKAERFDLAIAASHGGELHELKGPLLIVPHGMGYNKFLRNRKPETGNRKPVFGLSREWLTYEGRVIPSYLVLSHDEQLDRLRVACPEAVPVAVVAGDVTFDRLLASAPLRATYRNAFALNPGQRLVVVSSTWGPRSLFGAHPDLVRRLAVELPVDDYRIAVALHPNIWHEHSPWQVRGWLSAARRAGVVVLPELEGWKGALVAADIVLGDHGSVTFYATALGRSTLLASAPAETVAPDSPIARMLATVPELDPAEALLPQVHRADSGPGNPAGIGALASSVPGQASALVRALIYQALDLEPQAGVADTTAVPLLPDLAARPDACLVDVSRRTATEIEVTRFPAERLRDPHSPLPSAHLAVSTDEPRERWLQLADVVLNHHRGDDPAAWIRATLTALPGSVLAAMPDRRGTWFVGTAAHLLSINAPDGAAPLCISALFAWLGEGRHLDDVPHRFSVHTGAYSCTAKVTVHPADRASAG